MLRHRATFESKRRCFFLQWGATAFAATLGLSLPAKSTEAEPLQAARGVPLRHIVLGSEQEAVDVRARVAAGEPLELLARMLSRDVVSAAAGGYMGEVVVSDLRPEFRNAIEGLAPGELSAPVEVGGEYFLFQVLTGAEVNWTTLDEAGFRAYEQGRTAEAVERFQAALRQAEAFGEGDYRLARSLNNLAELYRGLENDPEAEELYRRSVIVLEQLVGPAHLDVAHSLDGLGLTLYALEEYSEAERAYRRSLEIREQALGLDHPDLAPTLGHLAEVLAVQGRYAEARPVYDRSVSLLADALGPRRRATVAAANRLSGLLPDVLERLASIVSAARFRDDVFFDRWRQFVDGLALVALDERSYVAIKDTLVEAALPEEAESVLALALEKLPASRQLRYHLAELFVDTGRPLEALEAFQEASRIEAAVEVSSESDRAQRGLIHRRIGDMHAVLFQFDQALAAYTQALELAPDTPGGRVALAELYAGNDRMEEAIEQYRVAVLVEPGNAAARTGLAEANLALGRWEEAARAAEEAIALEASAPHPRYLRGTALARLGRTDEGQAELGEFRRLDSMAEDQERRRQEVDALNGEAAAAFLGGNPEAAIELLRDGIEAYSEFGETYMNLGLILARLGRHQEAVDVFEAFAALGMTDDYLVNRYLAEEYAALGNAEAGAEHAAIYRQKRDAALRVLLPE